MEKPGTLLRFEIHQGLQGYGLTLLVVKSEFFPRVIRLFEEYETWERANEAGDALVSMLEPHPQGAVPIEAKALRRILDDRPLLYWRMNAADPIECEAKASAFVAALERSEACATQRLRADLKRQDATARWRKAQKDRTLYHILQGTIGEYVEAYREELHAEAELEARMWELKTLKNKHGEGLFLPFAIKE
jgi:hypothetical protein